MALVPFHAANEIGDRLLDLLQRNGIHPPIGSRLEDELLSPTQLVEVMKNPALASQPEQLETLRNAAGLHDLGAKVLSVSSLPDFATFVPHLRLIANSKVRAASIGQNTSSAHDDDTARKMAELYIGCLAAHTGTDVVLDSPTNAKGDNPDVMFTIQVDDTETLPQRWALAIKTISSKQGQTIFDRIKEGTAQINDPKCAAERGMVIINTKSALDHDALWNTNFADLDSAMRALGNQLDQLFESSNANRPQNEWDELFTHKAVRPILFLGQGLVRLSTPTGGVIPTTLKMFKAYDANGSLDPVALSLAETMNDFMQQILLGIPGSEGHWPC